MQYMKDYDVRFRILEDPLMTVGIGVAFANNDDRGLCEELDRTLEEMRQDGTSLKIIGSILTSRKNTLRWILLKKTTKSAAPGKKFWICGALLGICLLCLVALSLFQSDKAREQADLLGIVNYIKIQCATYTHYNEASESKSLLRSIESTRQVSTNIEAETAAGRSLPASCCRRVPSSCG